MMTDQNVATGKDPQEQLPEVAGSTAITPMSMIQLAVEQNADIEKLSKLMDLQERWEANEERKQAIEAEKLYTAAMSLFRENCPIIDKTRAGHNSKYAGLAETLEQIREPLTAANLSHTWKTEQANGVISVTCCVTHVAGHKECVMMEAEADTSGNKNSIQAIGSTNTYLQRYTLYSILGLASKEQDDDGVSSETQFITGEQVEAIKSLAKESQAEIVPLLNWKNVNSLSEIPSAEYDSVIKALEKKKGEAS